MIISVLWLLQEDPLYMSYAEIIAKSCGEEEEEGEEEEGGGGEEEGGSSIHVSVVDMIELLSNCDMTLPLYNLLLYA